MDKFRKLGISEHIVRVIEEQRFTEPSEIQEKAIPLVLEGKDVIAGSATGSGKTLVFGARIIQNTEAKGVVQALILTPTRELAEQITKALKSFSRYKKLTIIPVYGGVSINPQIRELRSADIVVGTPGRILDHVSRNTFHTENIKILVLDEADRMLDMGFIQDVEQIVRVIPLKRQTLLFSATIDPDIFHLAKKYMKNPVEVQAESYVDAGKLPQAFYEVQQNMKFSLLVQLLREEHPGLIMVFCNTRRTADFVAKNLKFSGVNATAIHGGFSQEKRTRIMDSFREKELHVLVCTDVAARGLDIKGVSHIYNYDIPKDSKDYIHRIGRTARAGKAGKAISLLSERDFENFHVVMKNPDLNIERKELPKIERTRIRWMPERKFERRDDRGGFRRGSGYGRSSGGSYGRRDDRRDNRGSDRGFKPRRRF